MSEGPKGIGGPSPQAVLGAVSFLNTKPLVAGLQQDEGIRLDYAVPSVLGDWLLSGQVDAALVPVVGLAAPQAIEPVSDACIASDGETLTVRVFSRVPPSRVRRLQVDGDSRTSVVLAKVLWHEMFGHIAETMPLAPHAAPANEEGVLLIGDKVITLRPRGFAFEMDLGAAWRELTGLPFVYAVWAKLAGTRVDDLAERLSASRDLGVSRSAQIADVEGPAAGWPVEIARRYLTEYMDYRLTDRHRNGMALFLKTATELGLLGSADDRQTEDAPARRA